MLNQIPQQPSSEANSSGIFLKNYLEYIEELPDEIIRIITKVRELDVKTSNTVNEVEELSEKIIESSGEAKSKLYSRLQHVLINLQDFNDEKIRYNQHLSELIETRFRSVERDFQNNIATKNDRPHSPAISSVSSSTARNASIVQQVLSNLPLKNSSTTGSNISSSTNNSASELNANTNGNDKGVKRARRTRNEGTTTIAEIERAETPVKNESNKASTSSNNQSSSTNAKQKNSSSSSLAANNLSNKKKKKKVGAGKQQQSTGTSNQNSSNQVVEQVSSQLDDGIDPDEETYCLCGQISYGEMILCENDACKIEWFHFSCVSLTNKPKGKWYCPNCRGERPNILNKNLRKKYHDSPNTDRKFL
ncbi:hypothetical protein PVAND_008062 [Polypedilum vanderplanki]|uniref:Inhibitor of growth protein n=1 Tax=Polypedilum vanderplanki TaxID=319348 RepID=A0A9J6C9T0_POLVA|nr:hypothetical protein PVAND_008062 [Polypedilum vanderplanki]